MWVLSRNIFVEGMGGFSTLEFAGAGGGRNSFVANGVCI